MAFAVLAVGVTGGARALLVSMQTASAATPKPDATRPVRAVYGG